MKKDHKTKINAAIGICEERFNDFDTYVVNVWNKDEAANLKRFLLDNTIFAGGIFRSTFTKTPVNDIDVFFTSQDAAIDFQHRMQMLKDKTAIFNTKDITHNQTYNFQLSITKPKLSFITEWAANPETLMNKFDFSLNQHWFKLSSYEMRFDMDTFGKMGQFLRAGENNTLRYYMRALRFQQEGFQLSRESWYQLAQLMTDKPYREVVNACQATASDGDGQKLPSPNLTGMYYTEADYFGMNDPYTKKNTYRTNAIYTNAAPTPLGTLQGLAQNMAVVDDVVQNVTMTREQVETVMAALDGMAPHPHNAAIETLEQAIEDLHPDDDVDEEDEV